MNNCDRQLTEKTVLPDSPFFSFKINDDSDELFRVYDQEWFLKNNFNNDEIVISELAVFFKYMSDLGMKLVLVIGEPNLKIILDDTDLKKHTDVINQDISFDASNITVNKKIIVNTCLTDNWVNIRNTQSDDLFLFFKNFFFQSMFIIPRITNNCYHFDMILAFKPDFDINILFSFKFKTMNIKNIIIIRNDQISFLFFKNLINFNNFSFCRFNYQKNNMWSQIEKNIFSEEIIKNSKEFLDFSNYLGNQLLKFKKTEFDLRRDGDYWYWYYFNLKSHKVDEFFYQNYDIFLKNCFYQLGFNIYTLNFDWKDRWDNFSNEKFTYPVNDTFCIIDSSSSELFNLNLNKFNLENYVINKNSFYFDFWGILDFINVLSCSEPYYCIQSFSIDYNIIKFRTNYKTFLKKNNRIHE